MSKQEQLIECNILIRKALRAGDYKQTNRLMDTKEKIIDQSHICEYRQAEQTIQNERANNLWHDIYSVLKALFQWTKK
jgi:hypothetical protein